MTHFSDEGASLIRRCARCPNQGDVEYAGWITAEGEWICDECAAEQVAKNIEAERVNHHFVEKFVFAFALTLAGVGLAFLLL